MPRKVKVGAPDLQQMNDDELVNHLEGMPRILDAHRSVLQKRLNRMQNDLYERAMRLLMRRDMRDRSTGIAF